MSLLTVLAISRISLENGNFGMRRLVDFWNLLISMSALVPGLYFLLPGVPATGDFLGRTLPLGALVCSGVEVDGLDFPLLLGTFSDLPFSGLLLAAPPVDFLATGNCLLAGLACFLAGLACFLAGLFLAETGVLGDWAAFFLLSFSAKLSSKVEWVRKPELMLLSLLPLSSLSLIHI